MKKILVTGFNAFGKVRVNPSELIIDRLAKRRPAQYELITDLLPTEYARATRRIKSLLRRERPDIVLCLGVAAGRKEVCLERIALNLDDEALADNAGAVRRNRPIMRSGPPVYLSTLPLATLLKALERRHIPSRISNHAGTYLCNHIFYIARHETVRRNVPAGFMHLPAIKTKRNAGMSLPTMLRAVTCCLDVLAG